MRSEEKVRTRARTRTRTQTHKAQPSWTLGMGAAGNGMRETLEYQRSFMSKVANSA